MRRLCAYTARVASKRILGWAIAIAFGSSVAVAGCATAVQPDDESTSGEGGDNTTASGGMNGVGGAGGSGVGGAGVGGTGGGPFPCGSDCSKISTGNPCLEAACNETTSMCEVVFVTAGTECDDGLYCTNGDSCQEGVCEGGPPNDCGDSAPDCNSIVCDEASRSCGVVPADEGTTCQLADLCVAGSTCQAGVCSGGAANDCFFTPVPNDCHVAVCNPVDGMCVAYPGNDGSACVDTAALCDVGKTCSLGNCIGGAPLDCSALTQGCFDGVCDAASGTCTTSAVMAGQQCAAATDECNIGICDNMTNCNGQPANEGGACDTDGCFVGQSCNTGSCQGGSEITTCINNDGCCPAICDLSNDDDCGCDFALISGETQLADPAITSLITANGHSFVLHDNNNAGVHTSNMALLNMYETIILQKHDRALSGAEVTNLTNWVQAGGRLLVTGYDSLGSPTDTGLAGVVNCLSPADGPFSTVLTVTNAVHPILQGPAQAFAPGFALTAGSSDHDTCQPGPGSVPLVSVTTSTKLIVTDNVGAGAGRVIYWSGNGPSTAVPEWTGTAGTQPDLQNLFVNVLDHMCQ